MSPAEVIAYIAQRADIFAHHAGVGGMETAGSIISFLAANPDKIDEFMADGSIIDWPFGWHMQGCLTWHGQDGKIWSPDAARRQQAINRLKKGEPA